MIKIISMLYNEHTCAAQSASKSTELFIVIFGGKIFYLKSASQNFGLFSENFKDIFSSKIDF